MSAAAITQIRAKVRLVSSDPAAFGTLSTGEKCAVALILNDMSLMQWWGTALDCADRLGEEWLKAAVYVQRNGWES